MYAAGGALLVMPRRLREPGAGYGHEPGPGRPAGPIPERLLAQLWQKRAARREALYDNGGRRVRVLYPGRLSGGPGPDFRDALLEMEGLGVVRGDVEVHRRAGDWKAHGHGRDPAYNSVVLHVALEGGEATTRLPSGRRVPVLSLAPLLSADSRADSPEEPGRDTDLLWERLAGQGYPRPRAGDELGALLDRAGDARFLAKSALFQEFLGQQSPDQTLFEAVMEALGYRRNQQAFLKLAARAPYVAIAQAAGQLAPQFRAEAIQSCLLRLSGLTGGLTGGLPGDEGGAEASLPKAGFGRPLHASEWHTAGGRPANHPRRRMAGAARLVDRFLAPGLAAGLGGVVGTGIPRALPPALTVGAESAGGAAALIGRGRAGDIAVNVVLPFCHGLARLGQDRERERTCRELYRGFGKLQENELTREMAGQLLAPGWAGVVTTARRQQGLLHLHHLLRGGG